MDRHKGDTNMPRLPQPGSDNGVWGDILNDYLSQTLNSDGSLKNDSVGAAQLQDSSVTDAKVAPGAAIAQSKIANLATDLAGKAAISHTHTVSQISDSTPTGRSLLTAADATAAKTALSLTKADVGLGNVDNTSDATKNAATATLTNKTISGTSNTLTNIPQDQIVGGVNLLAGHNPSFAADLSDWSQNSGVWVWDGAEGHAAAGSVRMAGDGSYTELESTVIPVVAGKTYRFEVWAKGTGLSSTTEGGIYAFWSIYNGGTGLGWPWPVAGDSISYISTLDGTLEWTRIFGHYTVPNSGVDGLAVALSVDGVSSGTVWLDDVTISAVGIDTSMVAGIGEAITASRRKYIKQHTTSLTPISFDLNESAQFYTITSASPRTVTVPTNASEPCSIGAQFQVVQMGTGQVTIAAQPGVTLRATPGLKISAQYGVATVTKIDTDEWLVSGNLSP